MTFIELIFIFGAKYLIFVLGALALYWFVRMERGTQVKILHFGTIALPLTYAFGFIAGLLFENPRPFVSEAIVPLIPHAANNGFPSDHALAAFAVAAVFIAFDKQKAKVLGVLALLVALSRVAVGVHHFLDIFASLMLAVIGWYCAQYIMKHFERKFYKKA